MIEQSKLETFLDRNGVSKTHEILQRGVIVSKSFLREFDTFSLPEQRFELELLIMAYFFRQMNSENSKYEEEFVNYITGYYSLLGERIAKSDPMLSSLFTVFGDNTNKYILDKINRYNLEIDKILILPNYCSRHIFASFLLYAMDEIESIDEKSGRLFEENVLKLQKSLLTIFELLNTMSSSII